MKYSLDAKARRSKDEQHVSRVAPRALERRQRRGLARRQAGLEEHDGGEHEDEVEARDNEQSVAVR